MISSLGKNSPAYQSHDLVSFFVLFMRNIRVMTLSIRVSLSLYVLLCVLSNKWMTSFIIIDVGVIRDILCMYVRTKSKTWRYILRFRSSSSLDVFNKLIDGDLNMGSSYQTVAWCCWLTCASANKFKINIFLSLLSFFLSLSLSPFIAFTLQFRSYSLKKPTQRKRE